VWLVDLFDRPERFDVLANEQSAVEQFISARTRTK
jgi:threonine synthase